MADRGADRGSDRGSAATEVSGERGDDTSALVSESSIPQMPSSGVISDAGTINIYSLIICSFCARPVVNCQAGDCSSCAYSAMKNMLERQRQG